MHQAVVTDDGDRAIGLITIQDVLAQFLGGGMEAASVMSVVLITSRAAAAERDVRRGRVRRRQRAAARRWSVARRAAIRCAARLLVTLTSPREQDRYIATAQIGITLASLGLGMYGEHTLALWLEPRLEMLGTGRVIASHLLASIFAVSVLSYLHIFHRRDGAEEPRALARGADGAAPSTGRCGSSSSCSTRS